MTSLDTNILLRLGLKDVPTQVDKIVSMLEATSPDSLTVADVALFECAWVLRNTPYHFDRPMIAKFLSKIASIPQISCNRLMLKRALPIFINNSNISFIDACLATYAELNNRTPLLTFDKKLAKALPKTVNLL